MLSLSSDVDILGLMPHGHPRGLDLGYDFFVATRGMGGYRLAIPPSIPLTRV